MSCIYQCHMVPSSRVLPSCGALTSVTGYSPPGCCLHLVHGPVSQSTPLQGATFLWCMDQCHRALPSRVLPSCGAWTMSQGTPLQSVAFIWCLDQCHRVLPSRVLPLFGAWTNVTGYSLPGCCPHVVHNLPVSQGTPLQSVASVWCINLCHRVLPSRASSAS